MLIPQVQQRIDMVSMLFVGKNIPVSSNESCSNNFHAKLEMFHTIVYHLKKTDRAYIALMSRSSRLVGRL